jgi:hypothetical protein
VADEPEEDAGQIATLVLKAGEPLVDQILAVVEPMLKGRGAALQGYIVAELAAVFIASHKVIGDDAATQMLRGQIFDEWASLVSDLVPVVARQRGIDSPLREETDESDDRS